MYKNSEIITIVKSCKTIKELYAVVACFNFLIDEGTQQKSICLSVTTQLRYRELENLI